MTLAQSAFRRPLAALLAAVLFAATLLVADATPAFAAEGVEIVTPVEGSSTSDMTPLFEWTVGTESNGSTFDFVCQVKGQGGYASASYCGGPTQEGVRSWDWPWGLEDDAYTFFVYTDTEWPTTPSDSVNFTLDTTPPTVTIDGEKPVDPTMNDFAGFFFSADEDVSFSCQLDDEIGTVAGPAACDTVDSPQASSKSYENLMDARYTFTVTGQDEAGNSASVQHTWTVDTTAAVVNITNKPDEFDNRTDYSFEFTTEGEAPECSLDEAAFAPCSSPVEHLGLAEGDHTFEVRAVDAAGNEGSDSVTWRVDTTAPETDIYSGPRSPFGDGNETNDYEVDFWFESEDASPVDFDCRLTLEGIESEGDFSPCMDTWSYNYGPSWWSEGWQYYYDLAEGDYLFEARATDRANNVEEPPASYAFTVDRTPANTFLIDTPDTVTNQTSAVFTFDSEDPSVEYYECNLDNGSYDDWDMEPFWYEPWQRCGPDRASYGWLSEGTHEFGVRSVDPAGNRDETPVWFTWTIDLTEPDTLITAGPEADSTVTNPTTTFEFVADGPVAGFDCRLDEGDWNPCASGDAFEAPEGVRTFAVRGIDEAGNVDPTPATRTWTVDTTGPAITIDGPDGLTNSDEANFSFSAEEDLYDVVCSVSSVEDEEPTAVECDSVGNVAPVSDLSDGDYVFTVEASDVHGNLGSQNYTWTVDLTAPDTEIQSGPAPVTNETRATIVFRSLDDDVASFECKLEIHSDVGIRTIEEGDGFETCTSPVELEGETEGGLVDGDYTFHVRAVDNATNRDDTAATVSWTVDTVVPTVNITAGPVDLSTVNTTATNFDFASEDEDTVGFLCSRDDGDWDECSSPFAYTAAEGNRTFEVVAVDAAGNKSEPDTRSWTVDTTAPVVTIGSGPSGTIATDDAEFAFSSSEDPFVDVECRMDAGAWSTCASPFSVDDLVDGSHTFEVRGEDKAGNVGSASRSWTVDTTAPQTSLTSRPSSSRSTSAVLRFRSSEASSTFECKLDGGAWAKCTSPRSLTGLSVGTHTFRVRATDAVGNTDATPAITAWQVEATPDEPTPDASERFTDVAKGNIFVKEITALADSGVTKGCTKDGTRFCPELNVTRGEMSAFLTRALDLPAGSKVFDDTRTHLFRADAGSMFAAGITKGCGGNDFCPDDFVTRGQMAAFLQRALNLPASDKVFDDTKGHPFQKEAAALHAAGITKGCGGNNFCPDEFVTREQMAAFLFRAGVLD